MTDDQLADLEKRLSEATGPSKELNELIYDTLFQRSGLITDVSPEGRERAPLQAWRFPDGSRQTLDDVTGSIDAADALRKVLLPEWVVWDANWSEASAYFMLIFFVEIGGRIRRDGRAPTPALAYCIAIVRALRSKKP